MAANRWSLDKAEAALVKDERVTAVRRVWKQTWLNQSEQEVLEVVPRSYREPTEVCTDLQKQHDIDAYQFFNVDIPIESRWMYDNGLFPFCRFTQHSDGRFECLDDRYAFDYESPELRTCRLQVIGPKKARKSYDEPVTRIHVNDDVIEAVGREREALLELGEWIARHDPDVWFTHGGDTWDMPYLLHRIRLNNLRGKVRLGRMRDPGKASRKEHSYWTYGQIGFKSEGWFLQGRIHVDLSKKFLPDSGERTDLSGLQYVARISNRRVQEMARLGPGSAIQQMQIDRAQDMGVLIPWKRNLVEGWKDAETLCAADRGGQIHVPRPGFYEDVAIVDYSAYYPSIIVGHNLSSDTLNCTCCPDAPVIPDLGLHVCQQRVGHQSLTLRPVIEHRRLIKARLKRGDLSRQERSRLEACKDELKAIGVVCFGYARFRHARFGCAEVHQGIQAIGRDGMTKGRVIGERHGFELIHGLTDSLFFQRPGHTRSDAVHLARDISHEVGVPAELEDQYTWVVLLPSKSHTLDGMEESVGVPNRYYGKRIDGTLKLRGIEVRQHSTPPYLRDVQERMLGILAEADTRTEFDEAMERVMELEREAVRDLESFRVDSRALAIKANVQRDVEDYRAVTPVKIALQKLRDAGIPVHPGQSIQYVVQRSDPSRPLLQRAQPLQLLEEAGPLGNRESSYDPRHYVKLLRRQTNNLMPHPRPEPQATLHAQLV